jgi:outer membrane beta-barrel protein
MNLGAKYVIGKPKLKAWQVGVLASFVLLFPNRSVFAQDMSFDINEADKGSAKTEAGADQEKGQGKDTGAKAEAGAEAKGAIGGDVLSQLAAGTETKKATDDRSEREQRAKEVAEEIYAVQRIYALRNGRIELAPSIAFTVNDQYVTHDAVGGALNYWISNVLAVGANVLWYQGLESESDLNFHVRRSTRLAVPVTQYQFGAHLNFSYVPIYGKFSMFSEYIFQWDTYLIGGVGMMRTKPIPVVDPAIRTFNYGLRVAFNVGLGLRVFVTRYLTVFAELRDYMYLEKLENRDVSLDARENSNTWLAKDATLTHNVAAQVGLTLFFPFTFKYKYPK